MDLCCLIDSEERLSATDLVTMLGDLLERGPLPFTCPTFQHLAHSTRNQVSCQNFAPCTDTHRQVIPRSFTWVALGNCVWYWFWEPVSVREYATSHVLCNDRSHPCSDVGSLSYVYPWRRGLILSWSLRRSQSMEQKEVSLHIPVCRHFSKTWCSFSEK